MGMGADKGGPARPFRVAPDRARPGARGVPVAAGCCCLFQNILSGYGCDMRVHLNEKRFSMILRQYYILVRSGFHLIGRKLNHKSSIFTFDSNKTKKTNSARSILGLLSLFVLFNLGSLSNSTWHVPATEASRANLCVVDCFTGEIHQSREAGPPQQPQREVRRPLAQSRPSVAPQKIKLAVANPVFPPSLPRNPHEHRRSHEFAQGFDHHIYPRRCCLRGTSGLRQQPKTSQER